MRFAWTLTLAALLLTASTALADGKKVRAAAEAPLVGEMNDPNAIQYGPARDALIINLEAKFQLEGLEDKQGFSADVSVGISDHREIRGVCYDATDRMPLGEHFADTQLARFLERRASGDLRDGKVHSEELIHDLQSVIEICGNAQAELAAAPTLKLLDDPNADVRESAYHWLACMAPEDPAVFDRLMKDVTAGKMLMPMCTQIHCLGPKAMPFITARLKAHHDEALVWAIGTYEKVDQPTIDLLTQLLAGEDHDLCVSVAYTLGHFGPAAKSAIPALVAFHTRETGKDDLASYAALVQMGPEAREAMLADARKSVKSYGDAMFALDNCRPYADGVPILIAALHHPDARVRALAAQSLWGNKAAGAIDDLVQCLNDPDEWVRQTAANTLGNLGPAASRAIPALRAAAARDKTGYVSEAALRSIEEINESIKFGFPWERE